jgi:hypothetical protein
LVATREETKDEIFNRLMECWQLDPLVEWFCEELQNAYSQGRADERKEFGERFDRIEGTLDFIKANGTSGPHRRADANKPLSSAVTEISDVVPEKASSKTERPKPLEGRKDVGGQINPKRPEGLETNIELAAMAITALGGAAAASQIQDWVRKNKWGGVPKYWNSSLYDLAAAKKLSRDGINFTLPKPAFEAISDEIVKRESVPQVEPEVLPKEQPRAPPAKTTIGLPLLEIVFVKFEYRDKAVMLDKHQWRIAEALKRAKGKGFLDYTFLGTQARGTASRHGVSDRTYLQEVVPILSEKLAKIGLVVEHTPPFGYTMKEAG